MSMSMAERFPIEKLRLTTTQRALPEPYCNHDAAAIRNGLCECGATVRTIALIDAPGNEDRNVAMGAIMFWDLTINSVTIERDGLVVRIEREK